MTPDIENVTGGSGNDALKGGGGPNILIGGDSADTIDGLAGTDEIHGGPGADVLQTQDGTIDTVTCGAGNDSLNRDPQDVVTADCEDVVGGGGFVEPGSLGEGGGGGGSGFAPDIIGAGTSIVVGKNGIFRLRLKCPKRSAKRCKGKITLKTKAPKKAGKKAASSAKKKKVKRIKIGSAKYTIKRGKKKWVRVKLSKRGRVLIAEVRKLKVTVIAQSGRGKKKKKKTKTIVLKAPKAVKAF